MHPAHCLLPGPLVVLLAVLQDRPELEPEVPARPLGQGRPKSADVGGFEALRGALHVSRSDTILPP